MEEAFDMAMLRLAALKIRECNLREIERAIDRIKEPQWAASDWFRRQWYRAGARRGQCRYIREPMRSSKEEPRARRWNS